MYFATLRGFRHGRNQRVGQAIGVAIKKSHPDEVGNLAKFAQKRRQAVAQSQILTVTRGVLADDGQLRHALARQVFRFPHHRGKAPGTEPAAHLRNHTK